MIDQHANGYDIRQLIWIMLRGYQAGQPVYVVGDVIQQ